VEPDRPRSDLFGDLLPDGALRRLGTSRYRLDWDTSDAVLSPDGKVVAVKTWGPVSLLDTETGQVIRRLPFPGMLSSGLTYSPDGTRLVLAGPKGLVSYDVKSGKEIGHYEFNARTGPPSVSFSADSTRLAVAEEDDAVVFAAVWDLTTGKRIVSLRPLHRSLVQVALAPDGKLLATWSDGPEQRTDPAPNQVVQLWDVPAGRERRRLEIAGPHPVGVAFAPDGKVFVVAESSAELSFYQAATGQLIRRLAAKKGAGAVLRYSPDGKVVASGSADGTLQLWDAHTGKLIGEAQGPGGRLTSVVFLAGNKVLAAGVKDQAVCLWEAPSGQVRTPTDLHTGKIAGLAFSRDGQTLVSVGAGDVRWWDPATGKQRRHLIVRPAGDQPRKGSRADFCLSPDGKYVAAGWRESRSVRVVDLEARGAFFTFPVNVDADGLHAAFGGKGSFAALSRDLRQEERVADVRTWDLAAEKEGRPLRSSLGLHDILALSPDGRLLAVPVNRYVWERGRDTCDLTLWDTAAGKELGKLTLDTWATALAFAPDNSVLATASLRSGGVRLWDVSARKQLRYLPAHLDRYFLLVAFSPDGRLLAGATHNLGTGECQVVVWDVASSRVRVEFSSQQSVTALAFSPDSRILAAGGNETTIMLWDLGKPGRN
jgi:WD40 repeat protein